MAKFLLVEDNTDLLANVSDWLTGEQHIVDSCTDGVQALAYLQSYEYDAIVLDWELPSMSGLEICKQYRAKGGLTPILMLTGRRSIDDKESGLNAGVDDYLTKPFEPRELLARLRALIRRATRAADGVLKAGNVHLDKENHRVTKDGKDIKLMPKEFAILELMMSYPSKVFSAEALIARVWSADTETSSEIVRKYINGLRKQIDTEGKPSLIRTVHGVGYGLDAKQE